MLFISVKKYKELQSDFNWVQGCYRIASDARQRWYEEVKQLHTLRTLDKECIKALLNLLVENEIPLSTFEDSLVDQTLNQ